MTIPAIKDQTLVTRDTFYNHHSTLINLNVEIEAGELWSYDIAAGLGEDAIKYELSRLYIDVSVFDTDENSPTNGFYIDAGALATIAFKVDGTVGVVNNHDDTLYFQVRVDAYRKALP